MFSATLSIDKSAVVLTDDNGIVQAVVPLPDEQPQPEPTDTNPDTNTNPQDFSALWE